MYTPSPEERSLPGEILERVKGVGVQPPFPPEDGPQRYRQLRQERLGSEELKHQLLMLGGSLQKARREGFSCQVTNSSLSVEGPAVAGSEITQRSRNLALDEGHPKVAQACKREVTDRAQVSLGGKTHSHGRTTAGWRGPPADRSTEPQPWSASQNHCPSRRGP